MIAEGKTLTAAAEVGIGEISFGFNLFTNEPPMSEYKSDPQKGGNLENGNPWGLQPGERGKGSVHRADINLDKVTNAAISDGRIKNPTLLNKLGFGKRGYYSVYLVSADGVDYHWYRQDKGGMWSHKPGITPIVNVDASGRFISNPVRANHGIYNNGGISLWVKRR